MVPAPQPATTLWKCPHSARTNLAEPDDVHLGSSRAPKGLDLSPKCPLICDTSAERYIEQRCEATDRSWMKAWRHFSQRPRSASQSGSSNVDQARNTCPWPRVPTLVTRTRCTGLASRFCVACGCQLWKGGGSVSRQVGRHNRERQEPQGRRCTLQMISWKSASTKNPKLATS